MSEVTFNSILDGVSKALHAAFPPPVQVHGGSVKQGLKPGDFNLVMPTAGHTKEVGHRYKRTSTVDVIYYPKRGAAECYDIAQRLPFILESITTPEGDVIHGTISELTVQDGVLHVLVRYDHHIYIPQEQTAMETLRIEQEG